jgi:hypothetical protein
LSNLTNNFTNTADSPLGDEIFDILETKYLIKKKRLIPNKNIFQHADWDDLKYVQKFKNFTSTEIHAASEKILPAIQA